MKSIIDNSNKIDFIHNWKIVKKDLVDYTASATEDLRLNHEAKLMLNSFDSKLDKYTTFIRDQKENPLFNIHFPANEPYFERGPGLTYLTVRDEVGHLDIFKKVFY